MLTSKIPISNSKLFLLLVFVILLSGCAPWIRAGQTFRTDTTIINSGESVGQTFTARYRGLSGIELFLAVEKPTEGNLILKLHPHPLNNTELTRSSLSLSDAGTSGFQRFDFPPISDSLNQDYYFSVEIEGQGTALVGTAPGNSYLDGALYKHGDPVDAQANFHLVYNPTQAAIGIVGMMFKWLGILLVGILLFALPGWALLDILWHGYNASGWFEKLALSVGVSLAIYPLVFLWTDLVGLHLGYLYAWLPPSISLAWFIWKFVGFIRSTEFSLPHLVKTRLGSNLPSLRSLSDQSASIALILTLGMVFAVRFWVIRLVDVPLWGDSYQHTMIAQLLVDNRGLFTSWLPYAELQTFTYHFGFHSLVAVFHWVTNLSLHQATLWTGQILNGVAVLALYPLATRLGGNRWAGVVAVLVAGLLLPMPMYYVNWGRYTQLAGQAILPIAVYLLWRAIDSQPRNWGLIVISWIVMAGLALTHYRVLIFAVIFIASFFLISARRHNFRALLLNTTILGVGAGALFLPWFLRVFQGHILTILGYQLSTPASAVSEWTQQYNVIGDLFIYLPAGVWLLMPILIGWGLWMKKSGIAVIALWWLLIFWVANPSWLGLPGEGALNNFAVFIAAYLPAGLILGSSMGWLVKRDIAIEQLSGRVRPALSLFLLVLVVFLGTWGLTHRVRDLEFRKHALVTRPDLRASQWIQSNVPGDARFVVNSFIAYGGSAVVGSDAGWWLPLLAQRQTTLSPLNYGSERGPFEDYHAWVTQLGQEIEVKGYQHPHLIAQYQDRGVTHVYIGQQGGQVNTTGNVLNPDELHNHPSFRSIYHQDRVWIFEFTP